MMARTKTKLHIERSDIIPDHWLIDAAPPLAPDGDFSFLSWGTQRTYCHKDHESEMCVIYVYLCLLELEDAVNELTECDARFVKELAPDLVKWAKTNPHNFKSTPFNIDDMDTKLSDIFMPWVRKWAMGNFMMYQFVCAASAFYGVCLTLPGFQEIKQWRNLEKPYMHRPHKKQFMKLVKYASQTNPSLAWAWELLLSTEYDRALKTQRGLARTAVRNQGYFHLDERRTLINARKWVMVRILNLTQTKVDTIRTGHEKQDIENISSSIKKFDKAFGVQRVRGAPLGKERAPYRSKSLYQY